MPQHPVLSETNNQCCKIFIISKAPGQVLNTCISTRYPGYFFLFSWALGQNMGIWKMKYLCLLFLKIDKLAIANHVLSCARQPRMLLSYLRRVKKMSFSFCWLWVLVTDIFIARISQCLVSEFCFIIMFFPSKPLGFYSWLAPDKRIKNCAVWPPSVGCPGFQNFPVFYFRVHFRLTNGEISLHPAAEAMASHDLTSLQCGRKKWSNSWTAHTFGHLDVGNKQKHKHFLSKVITLWRTFLAIKIFQT